MPTNPPTQAEAEAASLAAITTIVTNRTNLYIQELNDLIAAAISRGEFHVTVFAVENLSYLQLRNYYDPLNYEVWTPRYLFNDFWGLYRQPFLAGLVNSYLFQNQVFNGKKRRQITISWAQAGPLPFPGPGWPGFGCFNSF